MTGVMEFIYMTKRMKINYIIMMLIVLFDQITKALAAKNQGADRVIIPHLLTLGYMENSGATYGIFCGSLFGRILLIVLPIIAIGVFLFYMHKYAKDSLFMTIGITMVVAGAIANLIDRVFLGYVIDFICMPFIGYMLDLINVGNYYNNIADISVFIGVFVFLIAFIVDEVKKGKTKAHAKNHLE